MADRDKHKDTRPKQDRTEELRQIVREDIEEQRQLVDRFRRKMN